MISHRETVHHQAAASAAAAAADGQAKSLRAALTSDYIITQPSKEFLKAITENAGPALADLAALANDPSKKKALEDYLWGMEFIDFLLAHPVKWTAEEFVKTLRKLQRLPSLDRLQLKANPGRCISLSPPCDTRSTAPPQGRRLDLPRGTLGRQRHRRGLRPHG